MFSYDDNQCYYDNSFVYAMIVILFSQLIGITMYKIYIDDKKDHLLFKINDQGNTVFHVAAQQKDTHNMKLLCDVLLAKQRQRNTFL